MNPGVSRYSALALLLLTAPLAPAAPDDLPFFRSPVVCFPPVVPIFGEEISDRPPPGDDARRLRPPPELSDYVSESFYPALSTRLIDGSLGKNIEARLEAYRARRGALVNELADQLVALNEAEETTRTTQLRAFAEVQNPRIAALEREAEELRRFLIDGGFFRRSADWSRSREWMIGVTRFSNELYAREAEYQVVRAAAFYHHGLLPEQRGLLLERAAELRLRARAARPIPTPRRDDPSAMFFSPATSRLRLPPKMSPELSGKVGRYNALKTELKNELHRAVLEHDATPIVERTGIFEELAERQWPRLAELEAIAEEIRTHFAALPPMKLTAPPYIPPALIARIDGYTADRRRFIDEFNETMRAASDLVRPPLPDPDLGPEERARRARQYEMERAATRAKVAAAYQEATEERFRELRQRYDRLQEELKVIAAGQFDPETGRPLDADGLLRNYSIANERFATFGREEVIYRGYRTAMLMPGLSREQRRLLFAAAIVGLAQPLPFGEPIPTGQHPVPRS